MDSYASIIADFQAMRKVFNYSIEGYTNKCALVYINLFYKFDVKADPRFKNPKTPSIVPVDFKFDFKAFNQKN